MDNRQISMASSDCGCYTTSEHATEIAESGDSKFRKALENMRYKSCTDADIQLIRSRIAGRAAGNQTIS